MVGGVITPAGLFRLCKSLVSEGITLMALMRFSALHYPDRCALVSEGKRFTYKELYDHANRLARVLHADYHLTAGACVGVLCRNHIVSALLPAALSRLGVRIKLMNTDIALTRVNDLVRQNNIKLLIYDAELKATRIPQHVPCPVRASEDLLRVMMDESRVPSNAFPHPRRGRDISVFTGGSSGHYKETPRRMTVGQYLPPLYALLKNLHIATRDSVFLPLPLYHGFGLATLVVSFLMGKKVCLVRRFEAKDALQMIADEQVDVLTTVPAMLSRMWQTDRAAERMASVKCIISGGDRLDRSLVEVTTRHLGKVLYNLFGTSEAGFLMMASPDDLTRHAEVTIGQHIRGVSCKIAAADSSGTSPLWVRSGWAMTSLKNKWQATGDLVIRNGEGYYFYRGRQDNMVVCGGENVYPEHVEQVINSHPDVVASTAFPITDSRYGTVLHAQIELRPGSTASPDDLQAWLRPRLSRAEMPHQMTIAPLVLLETGKRRS